MPSTKRQMLQPMCTLPELGCSYQSTVDQTGDKSAFLAVYCIGEREREREREGEREGERKGEEGERGREREREKRERGRERGREKRERGRERGRESERAGRKEKWSERVINTITPLHEALAM